MLFLEKFPDDKRVSIEELTTALDGLYNDSVVDLPHHRSRLVLRARSKMQMVKHSLIKLQKDSNGPQINEPTRLVVDWYIQTVGNIFVNYMRGYYDSLMESGGLSRVSLDKIHSIGCLNHQLTRDVIEETFDNEGEHYAHSSVEESMTKLVLQHFIKGAPFELLSVITILLRAIEQRVESKKYALEPVTDLKNYREAVELRNFHESADGIIRQIVDAFCYLRKRNLV